MLQTYFGAVFGISGKSNYNFRIIKGNEMENILFAICCVDILYLQF